MLNSPWDHMLTEVQSNAGKIKASKRCLGTFLKEGAIGRSTIHLTSLLALAQNRTCTIHRKLNFQFHVQWISDVKLGMPARSSAPGRAGQRCRAQARMKALCASSQCSHSRPLISSSAHSSAPSTLVLIRSSSRTGLWTWNHQHSRGAVLARRKN